MDLLYRDALSCSEWGVAKGSSFSHKLEHLCLAHGLFVLRKLFAPSAGSLEVSFSHIVSLYINRL